MSKIIAHNGDCWSAPASTIEGLWAGLGAGADALFLDVFLTADQHVVCSPEDNLLNTCARDENISALTLAQVQQLDAGATWRSSVLDEQAQPTGARGEDTPWSAEHGRRISLVALSDVLRIMGRRTSLYIRLPTIDCSELNSLAEAVTEQLTAFGLSRRVALIAPARTAHYLRIHDYQGLLFGDLCNELNAENIAAAKQAGCDGLMGWAEQLADFDSAEAFNAFARPWLAMTREAFTPKLEVWTALQKLGNVIEGVIVRGALPSVERQHPPSPVMQDSFKNGTDIDQNLWTAGYSHTNQDTRIYQDDGLHIAIKQGGSYSGAAAVTCNSYFGDFDAQVDFHVAAPHQGTTFEMAAIGIDPGYFNINNSRLSGKKVNLTFDVHGAPPYASSERDEDDGFRTGWNNSFNLTKVGSVSTEEDGSIEVDNWAASSVNMYNKYRRDVGTGVASSPTGTLRLVRSGALFTSYYQDALNRDTWVCSGTVLVPNLAEEAFIRLAAKHWKKRNPEPPKNHITFSNFKLMQY